MVETIEGSVFSYVTFLPGGDIRGGAAMLHLTHGIEFQCCSSVWDGSSISSSPTIR